MKIMIFGIWMPHLAHLKMRNVHQAKMSFFIFVLKMINDVTRIYLKEPYP